jgi:ATP-dependent Clp protease adapter protein ClpS
MNSEAPDVSKKRFVVSIWEIKQTLVLAEECTEQFTKTVTLSDGRKRTVQLTPMMRKGESVIEFKEADFRSYMGMARVRHGGYTNGNLMIQISDLDDLEAARAEWLSRVQAASPVLPSGASLLSRPDLVPAGFAQGIEILNDNTTPMEFVVDVLSAHVGLDLKDSTQAMLAVHTCGGVLIPTTSLQEAERIAAQITAEAAKQGYPLKCRAASIGS